MVRLSTVTDVSAATSLRDTDVRSMDADCVLNSKLERLEQITLDLGQLFGLDELVDLAREISRQRSVLGNTTTATPSGYAARLESWRLLESVACRLIDSGTGMSSVGSRPVADDSARL